MQCQCEYCKYPAQKYWLRDITEKRRLRYTPQQLYCTVCSDRQFYLMAQEDGTLEAFCAKNNHKRVLVNVPELAGEVYEAITAEVAAALAGGSTVIEGPQDLALQAQSEAHDAIVQHGASTDADSKG